MKTRTSSKGFAVATITSGILISAILPSFNEADAFRKSLGCSSYITVEVRS